MPKDACYHKVVARYGPKTSAYRSGAMAKCRKVGAANWGNKSKKEDGGFEEPEKFKRGGVRKTKAGARLKRWFKEKWKDEKGNPCGSSKNKRTKKCRPTKRISKETPVTWKGVGKRKASVVAEKKRVGMGKRTSAIRKRKTNAKKKRKSN